MEFPSPQSAVGAGRTVTSPDPDGSTATPKRRPSDPATAATAGTAAPVTLGDRSLSVCVLAATGSLNSSPGVSPWSSLVFADVQNLRSDANCSAVACAAALGAAAIGVGVSAYAGTQTGRADRHRQLCTYPRGSQIPIPRHLPDTLAIPGNRAREPPHRASRVHRHTRRAIAPVNDSIPSSNPSAPPSVTVSTLSYPAIAPHPKLGGGPNTGFRSTGHSHFHYLNWGAPQVLRIRILRRRLARYIQRVTQSTVHGLHSARHGTRAKNPIHEREQSSRLVNHRPYRRHVAMPEVNDWTRILIGGAP